jgi:mRNA interferase MazF
MTAYNFGEASVRDWQAAELLKPSVIKPALATLEQRLVRKTLGRLSEVDRSALKACLQSVIG